MFCSNCGAEIAAGQRFCSGCGKTAGAPVPMMPVRSRLAGHIRMLGILWLAVSALRLIPGIALITMVSSGFPPMGSDVPAFVPVLLNCIGYGIFITGAIGLIVGWGLLDRQHWARMAAIILGGIALVELPFGTALGIYTLWVLLPAQSEEEYRQMSRAA
jgi:hypothetical protein